MEPAVARNISAMAAPATMFHFAFDAMETLHIAGSSGTPRGFNDAIQKIKQQAAT